ncbi:MAG: hypothetical protein RR942_01345 [Romboutsia sp.]
MGFFNINNNSISSSMSSTNGMTKVTINGKTTIIKGENVSVINGKIYVNGKLYKDEGTFKEDYIIQNVTIEGNVEKVDCGGSVIVNGDVKGNIDCGGSISIGGEHVGSIDCGGSVRIGSINR